MNNWTGALPYFPERELRCQGTGIILLDIRFAAALPSLRNDWGKPLTPTSVCRAPEHNRAVNGHPNSLHLTENPKHPTFGTMAADIFWQQWEEAEKLRFARFAYARKWSIGLHDIFCHIDRRAELESLNQAVFLYGSSWTGFSKDEVIV